MKATIKSRFTRIFNVVISAVLVIGLMPTLTLPQTAYADEGDTSTKTVTIAAEGNGTLEVTGSDNQTVTLNAGDSIELTQDEYTYATIKGYTDETTYLTRYTPDGEIFCQDLWDEFEGDFETWITFDNDVICTFYMGEEPEVNYDDQISLMSWDEPYVGETFYGGSSVEWVSGGNGHTVHGVGMGGSTGILAEKGTVTGYCQDHGRAAPYAGGWYTYTATVTGINEETGEVNLWVIWYGTGDQVYSDGYQRVGCTVIIYRDFGGWAKVKKTSANPSITEGNDCYSFEGAEFTFYDSDGNAAGKVTCDANGDSGTVKLSKGTYTVKETVTPEGYWTADDQTVTITSGNTTTVTVADEPSNDPVSMIVGKYDGEKTYYGSGNLPQGAASLANAEFTVEYYDTVDYDSYDSLKSAGETPTRSWVVKTNENGFASLNSEYLVRGDSFYYSTEGLITLPRGTVVIYESKAPTGYLLNDEDVSFQKIQETPLEGVITYNMPEVADEVYRSDFEFTKKSDSGDRLANVAFKITSKTTEESHVIVTDENGYFSSASSWNRHAYNTNGNDWALDETGVIDSSKLDNTAGLWFDYNLVESENGEYSLTLDDGTVVSASRIDDIAVDESKGALPYDTYEIEELRCTANEGYQLVKTTIVISRDGQTYDFGTLDDIEALIHTTAYDPIDNDSYIGVGEVKIADKVEYSNVIAGRNYTVKGELHDAETGDAILGSDGKVISASTTFTAEESSGEVTLEFPVSTFDKSGKTIVVYEYLYDSGNSLLAKHDDASDVSQQVTVVPPTFQTTATDAADGDKTVSTDDMATVIDTVEYTNLIVGKEYVLTGTLHYKKTDADGNVTDEGVLTDADGKEVTASTTFTPETANGTVDVTFTFNSTALPDASQLVAFEALSEDNIELLTHADISDVPQTVTIENPVIGTTALDAEDNDKNIITDDESTIIDTVEYSGVVPGKEYTLSGKVMVISTDSGLEPGTTVDIDAVSGSTDDEFAGSRERSVTYNDDGSYTVTTHYVNSDYSESTEEETFSSYDELDSSIQDVIKAYVEANGGTENVTAEPLTDSEGNEITASTTFTPGESAGTVNVTFTFDSREIPDGTKLVIYESLYKNGNVVVTHEDATDVNQIVEVTHPYIKTTALDGWDNDKNVVTDAETTIVDTVHYENVIPGKEYVLTGTLHVKYVDEDGNVEDDGVLLDAEGNEVTSSVTFTPEHAEGDVDVTFTFDSTAELEGTTLVAFEDLSRNGVIISTHADIEDEDQSTELRETEIGTTATDGLDGDKVVVADENVTITDEVAYDDALTGQLYTMAGILMDADTGLPILTGEGSEKYTDEQVAEFMNELLAVFGMADESGSAEAVVSQLTVGDITTTQSVRVNADGTYQIITSITGFDEDGVAFANVDEGDRVSYDELTDEAKAAADALAVTSDGGAISYDGTGNLPAYVDMAALTELCEENADLLSYMVYQTEEFTPEDYDGTISMDFNFNANDVIDRLNGETKNIVVFEVMFKDSLTDEGTETTTVVATHTDLTDEGQTVELVPSEIGTTATDKTDGDHELLASTESVVVDTVEYKNLIPGKEYTLHATLMNKETGEALIVNDKQVTAELKFTPNSADGTVDIELGAFDTTGLVGQELVAFEELTKQDVAADGSVDEVIVAEHKDIDDEGQTVTVTDTPNGSTFGKTGGSDMALVIAILALAAIGGGCGYYAYRTRKKNVLEGVDSAAISEDADE